MLGFWIALAVFVLSVGAGLALAGVRGLQTWRQLKATRALIGAELERIAQATGEIERHLAAAGTSSERLGEALERLTGSRQRLVVQLSAVAEARTTVRRLLPFLPR